MPDGGSSCFNYGCGLFTLSEAEGYLQPARKADANETFATGEK